MCSVLLTNIRLLLITFYLFHMYEPSWSQSTSESFLPGDSLDASSSHLIRPHHGNYGNAAVVPGLNLKREDSSYFVIFRDVTFSLDHLHFIEFYYLTLTSSSLSFYTYRVFDFLMLRLCYPILINLVNGFCTPLWNFQTQSVILHRDCKHLIIKTPHNCSSLPDFIYISCLPLNNIYYSLIFN